MGSATVWHFMAGESEPILFDGSPVVVGKWLRHVGQVSICESGLHASRRPIDALKYAPGEWVALCEVRRIEAEQEDKIVCRSRKPLWCYDATDELRAFARRCALDVIDKWDAPEIVRRYLETGDESIRDAAWDAAWNAAWAAAWTWARDAAWAAAMDAVWTAASFAALAAALAASWAVPRDARLTLYNEWLDEALMDGAKKRGLA